MTTAVRHGAMFERLLCQTFTNAEFHMFLSNLAGIDEGDDLLASLPSILVPRVEYMHHAVQALSRRGMLDSALFDSLANARPRLRNEFLSLMLGAELNGCETKSEPRSEQGFLASIQSVLDDDLQDAFAIAYSQTLRLGKDRISTERLFSAMIRLNSELAEPFPSGALPDATPSLVAPNPQVFETSPPLSSCVEESLSALRSQVNASKKIRNVDIFVDLAKYSRGISAHRLRTHGVDSDAVDSAARTWGWDPLTRGR